MQLALAQRCHVKLNRRSIYSQGFPLQHEHTEVVTAGCSCQSPVLSKGVYSRTTMNEASRCPQGNEAQQIFPFATEENQNLGQLLEFTEGTVARLSLPALPFPAHRTALPACPAALGHLPSPLPQPWQRSHRTAPERALDPVRPLQGSYPCPDEQSDAVLFPWSLLPREMLSAASHTLGMLAARRRAPVPPCLRFPTAVGGWRNLVSKCVRR